MDIYLLHENHKNDKNITEFNNISLKIQKRKHTHTKTDRQTDRRTDRQKDKP